MKELRDELGNAVELPALTVATSLPSVLNGTASKLDVARSLLAICAVLLFLLAAAALLAVARLLAGQREGESAMLTARGATRRQLLRLGAAEAVPLCLLCAVTGALAGIGLARLLAGSDAADVGWAPFEVAAAVAVGALVIMLVPVLSIVTPGTARARRGRQGAIAGVTRAGVDVALILLAVVAGWELRHYSAVSAGASGNFGVDPVIVAAPALALAGGTVLALRLLPAGGKAGDLLAARGRRLTAAMASWQISRLPIRQGGAALLIVLAVATGTLALSQRQSWTRSVQDQAAFSAGADVRVQASQPLSAGQAAAVAGTPGVQHAMPVATFPQEDINGVTLAVGTGQAANVTLLRPDQSSLPAAALFGKIRTAGPAPGVPLPGRSTTFRLTARLGPAALGLGPAAVTVSVEDAADVVYQVQAGSLPADGREHALVFSLGSSGDAIYPLRLTAVSLAYTLLATPGPRAGRVHRGRRDRRQRGTGHGGPWIGTARLAGRRLVGRTGRRPSVAGHRWPVRAARRRLGPDHGRRAGGDVQPGLRPGGERVGRHPAEPGVRAADARPAGSRGPSRPGHPGLPRHEQHERRLHRADQHRRHDGQREDRGGGDELPHGDRPRRRAHRRPGRPAGLPGQRFAGARAGDAVVAGHRAARIPGSRLAWPGGCRPARPSRAAAGSSPRC